MRTWSFLAAPGSLLELPLLAAHGAVLLGLLRVEPLEDAVHVEAVRALAPHQRAVITGHLACGGASSEPAAYPQPTLPAHGSRGLRCSLGAPCPAVLGTQLPELPHVWGYTKDRSSWPAS